MRVYTGVPLLLIALAWALLSVQALAEPFGLLNGRPADDREMADKSVEVGVVTGDIGAVEYQHFGARYNYRLSRGVMIHADLGFTDLDNRADGFAMGLGVFLAVDDIVSQADFALHGSFHRASLSIGGQDFDRNSLTLEGVFSGKEPLGWSENLTWNANIGLSRTSGDGDSETELMIGGGIVVKNSSGSGEFYVGALYVEELGMGGGYRHFLK